MYDPCPCENIWNYLTQISSGLVLDIFFTCTLLMIFSEECNLGIPVPVSEFINVKCMFVALTPSDQLLASQSFFADMYSETHV